MVKKKSQKKVTKNTLKGWMPAPREPSTLNDVKTAVLLVSLTINLAIFVGWLVLKLTNIYDDQVIQLLFTR